MNRMPAPGVTGTSVVNRWRESTPSLAKLRGRPGRPLRGADEAPVDARRDEPERFGRFGVVVHAGFVDQFDGVTQVAPQPAEWGAYLALGNVMPAVGTRSTTRATARSSGTTAMCRVTR